MNDPIAIIGMGFRPPGPSGPGDLGGPLEDALVTAVEPPGPSSRNAPMPDRLYLDTHAPPVGRGRTHLGVGGPFARADSVYAEARRRRPGRRGRPRDARGWLPDAEGLLSHADGLLPHAQRLSPDADGLLPHTEGLVPDMHGFDAVLFGMDADQAAGLDPRQRLLMMTAWEALEDAGLRPSRVAGDRTAVFIGNAHMDEPERPSRPSRAPLRTLTPRDHRGTLSRRLSATFGLCGPSVTLDTACTSSLTAVHLACQSLRTGDAGLALAGGVDLRPLADDGAPGPWDALTVQDARRGFARVPARGRRQGDGVRVVVLKRLDRALADGDAIRGVILGTAVSSDGATDGPVLRPAASGMIDALRWAYQDAGADPTAVDHRERPPLAGADGGEDGSGHVRADSGMAGLMSTVLRLEQEPRQNLDLDLEYGMAPPTPAPDGPGTPVPWHRPAVPASPAPHDLPEGAVARVSGTGLSAVNVHVVLGRAPAAPHRRSPASRRHHLFTMSALSQEALARLARAYLDLLEGDDAPPLSDLCYSAAVRRDHHPLRFAAVVESAGDLREALAAFPQPRPSTGAPLDGLAARYLRGEEPTDWEGAFDVGAVFVRLPLYPWRAAPHWSG
ncbi:beta-ketoacyl synthase N-terminal-like domain-containing protein [Sphaerisporangium sp. NPDC005288]|uniref:beta-ketoacyl synthase N-terminal-like domain-containing protein n=1 Tax=Sphaerisporangium sp. NPDC005288 TaxID=3155114 RepID=UPI0033BE9BEC